MWTEKRPSSKEQLEAIFNFPRLLLPKQETGPLQNSSLPPDPKGLSSFVLFLGAARGWIVLGKIEPWIINTLRYWVTIVKELENVMQVKESDI